jgi:hypothetical protein
VLSIPCDQNPPLIRVPEWRTRTVHDANDLAESDLGWGAPHQYPPLVPRTLSTIRACFNSIKISSRKFTGRSLSEAMSEL